ncbi:MAG: DUF6298 domain-containing protein, partial [Gemmatimonadaceae bacterium]
MFKLSVQMFHLSAAFVAAGLAAGTCAAEEFRPVRLHPQNPRVFEFRGKPLVLITATEHYGAVMNRPFDFERYLGDAAEKRMTLTRLFVLYRELQTALNPYSTCKPESTDYISPYPRMGPGLANDRLAKFDLDHWNPEFFDRLKRFLTCASRSGIVVEVTLFSNTYGADVWALNPLNPLNNINDTEMIVPAEFLSVRHPNLFSRQQALVRKVVAECNPFDNVILEICNEPSSNLAAVPAAGARANPDAVEMDAWQGEIAHIIRETEAVLPLQHLISGQASYTTPAILSSKGLSLTSSFKTMPVDIVNVHTFNNTSYEGTSFDIGNFMTGELRLKGLRELFLATSGERKPLNLDEDNAAARFTDVSGWTIHRKRAWTTVLCGGHYDMIDFSIQNRLETGTPESRAHLRSWMKHLSGFAHSLDLARSRPLKGLVTVAPPNTVVSALGVESEDYAIYVADAREAAEPGCGEAIRGEIVLSLPRGRWRVTTLSPVTGEISSQPSIDGGEAHVELPGFRHDLALRLKRDN